MDAGLSSITANKKVASYTPYISIYLPTHKKLDKSFKTRDRVKFMRILTRVEKHLFANGLNRVLISKILKPAKELIEDQKFWVNQNESLVVFMSDDFFEYYQLPVKSELAAYIDNEFMVAPLAVLMTDSSPQPIIPQKAEPKQFIYKKKTA